MGSSFGTSRRRGERWLALALFVAAAPLADGCTRDSTGTEGAGDGDAGEGTGGTGTGGTPNRGGAAGTPATSGAAGTPTRGGTSGATSTGGLSGAGPTGGTGPLVCDQPGGMGGSPSGGAGESSAGEGGAAEDPTCVCGPGGGPCTVNWAGLCIPGLGCKPKLDDLHARQGELCTHRFPVAVDHNDGFFAECDDDLVRFIVNENLEDYSFELVFNRSTGSLVYGALRGEFERCDGMEDPDVEDDEIAGTIRTSSMSPALGCRSCAFCVGSTDGQAGSASIDDCEFDAQCRLRVPE